MTTPDTEKLSQDSIEHTLEQVIYLTVLETLKQMLEEIKTMTDFNPQDRWEAGFDEAICAVIVRIKEKKRRIEMKCICCDKKLSDFEATRKHAVTGAYLDMCNRCLQGLDIPTKDRIDLLTEADCGENTTDSDEETLDKSGEVVYNNNYIDTEE